MCRGETTGEELMGGHEVLDPVVWNKVGAGIGRFRIPLGPVGIREVIIGEVVIGEVVIREVVVGVNLLSINTELFL